MSIIDKAAQAQSNARQGPATAVLWAPVVSLGFGHVSEAIPPPPPASTYFACSPTSLRQSTRYSTLYLDIRRHILTVWSASVSTNLFYCMQMSGKCLASDVSWCLAAAIARDPVTPRQVHTHSVARGEYVPCGTSHLSHHYPAACESLGSPLCDCCLV